MRRESIKFHASAGGDMSKTCWVDGGTLPPRFCPKCQLSPDDQIETLIRRLENVKATRR